MRRGVPGARGLLVLVHRWAGLAMAGFLLIAGLTGSLLAWLDELETTISPQLMLATPPTPGARPLDPFVLHEAVLAHIPSDASAPWIPLRIEPGRSLRFGVAADRPLPYDDVYVDPYRGTVLGERKWGDITQGTKSLMSFVYRLHYSLALDRAGVVLMGIVALVWTLDCFVGAYLTFPPRRKSTQVGPDFVDNQGARHYKRWLGRWWPAWKVRWASGSYKLNFDLHRAGGLWTWAMLFVLAWSSVAFNLSEVYAPVTKHMLGTQKAPVDRSHVSVLAQPRHDPALSPRAALEIGRRLMAEQAELRGFTVQREEWLGYEPGRALYTYMVRSSRDIRERYGGNTRLFFDGDSGEFRGLFLPTGEATGDTFTTWITSLHMAGLWGLPLKIVICVLGLVIALLSVTGIVVWSRKRRASERSLLRRSEATTQGRRKIGRGSGPAVQ